MNNKQITIGLVALLAVGVYVLLKKPSFEKMREELWLHFLKDMPAAAPYKENYLASQIWNNRAFVSEWYKAYKNGSAVFVYNEKRFQTKNGLGL